MSFELNDTCEQKADIKVIGVGGCGNNAIEHMIKNEVSGVDFICVNTDSQDLANNSVSQNSKFQIGLGITKGLGAGADPEVGRKAALEDKERLREVIEGCDMLFITAGMGGGTGTGASPVIAELAKELNILTVAVVTKPWEIEKKRRMENAEIGIQALKDKVDSLIIIPNDKLLTDPDMTMSQAKNQSNDVLERAVGGIAELITKPGDINLDFADVKKVMSNAGSTMMGSGIGEGQDRAEDAIQQAIASPLLEDIDVKNAKGLIINIASDDSLTVKEFQAIGDIIDTLVDKDKAEVILGNTIDRSLNKKLKVTVVATGIGNSIQEDVNEEVKVDIVLDPAAHNPISEKIIYDENEGLSNSVLGDCGNLNSTLDQDNHDSSELNNYAKEDEYKRKEKEINQKAEEKKSKQNIAHKNGELDLNNNDDLNYLNIPAWLRRQAD
ncbi:MAG: cell division protein FtsZ [Gammaproteobacteria bacterium]|jgi:cell division protein FtsZ|nr:cell division protein FtsZ [Gammaproteobacteria bacterium]MBT7603049.1 cell division protein FtsZ [Gammaproteobacteria bacterium]